MTIKIISNATSEGGNEKMLPVRNSRKEHEKTNGVVSQGAEAIILLDKENNQIIKQRIPKLYRIKELDNKIRKHRTKVETKLLEKAGKIISVPKVIKTNEKEKEIIMEFIDGEKLSEHLDKFELKKQLEICKKIGESISKLHHEGLIHGDLTTSNMILKEDNSYQTADNFKKQLTEIKKLNFPIGEYALFGSCPLGVRGIRDSRDIDMVVDELLWKKLAEKYKVEKFETGPTRKKFIKIGEIEVYPDWLPWLPNTKELIQTADIIEGVPFVKLKYVLEWKKTFGREKDRKDVKLIKKYQSSNQDKVYLIDFGLGYQNGKHEDKAVDLHVLKQALEAKHFLHWEKLWNAVKTGYQKANKTDSKKVLERLTAVERRGRNKH